MCPNINKTLQHLDRPPIETLDLSEDMLQRIEEVGLSEGAIREAKRFGHLTIGAWIGYFGFACAFCGDYRQGSLPKEGGLDREMLLKMKTQAFWPLFEDEFYPEG